MTKSTGKLPFRSRPRHPGVKPIQDWPPANADFYHQFCDWLSTGSYSESTLNLYSVSARLALGFLDKPYWGIDADADLMGRVTDHMATLPLTATTQREYRKGLLKLAQYLRERLDRPARPPEIHWEYHVGPLPAWLQADVRAFVAHRRRNWPAERVYRCTLTTLSHLTCSLRWMAGHTTLRDARDLTPNLWYEYVDARLAAGITTVTLNREWASLCAFVRFLADQGRAICPRLPRVDRLEHTRRLPRDVPVEQLRRLRQEIEQDAASSHAGVRRCGIMDRAWFLLMLYSGLRTGEVRELQLRELDIDGGWVHIEQSKGLKDRNVCLAPASVEALRAYLPERGTHSGTGEPVFVYRHLPLTRTYCATRLETYGRRCGVRITPHQLRHSAATLLLNAGALAVTVQALLGHDEIDTTLGYARLYDTTLAADYYQAIARVESHGALPDDALRPLPGAQLLAVVDALGAGPLSEAQRERVDLLRAGLQRLLGLKHGLGTG